MSSLIDAALAYIARDRPFRVLVAPAGDGRHLVAVAEAMHADPRFALMNEQDRVEAVLSRIGAADRVDGGADRAIRRWASTDSEQPVVSFGDLLAFADQPVQGELFGEVRESRAPECYADAPFDLVVADVPRAELSAGEREHLRGRFNAVSGQFTEEIPLIERLAGLVAPDGVLALRVRKAILRREFGRGLVHDLGQRMQLLGLQDDGTDEVIAVLRATGHGDGAVLLRAFGSESAARVLRTMEQAARGRLRDNVATPIGSTSNPGYDEIWQPPRWVASRVPTTPYVRGGDIDHWRVAPSTIVWPYDDEGRTRTPADPAVVAVLSRFRALLEQRELFGQSLQERGVRWWEYLEHHPARWSTRPAIAIARSGVHPRLAILREPAVVASTAVVVCPHESVDPHFLAGILSSRLASFWMKQVFHVYQTEEGTAFEVTATGIAEFPVPAPDDAIAEAARAIERTVRSLRDLRSCIDGDPERLDLRIESAKIANAAIRSECARHYQVLDQAVLRAYGVVAELIADEPAPAFAADPGERDVLLDWLVERVSAGFESGELATDRPVVDTEVDDWLRQIPLCRAVLTRLGVGATEVLIRGAVPLEPDLTFAPSGLEKLRRWADGDPIPFHRADYAALPLSVPRLSSSRLRNLVWGWRGRFNAPREAFSLLGNLSRERQRPFFAWAGAELDRDGWDESGGTDQVDLELVLVVRSLIAAQPRTESQLIDALFGYGWSSADLRLALEMLRSTGSATHRAGTWRCS